MEKSKEKTSEYFKVKLKKALKPLYKEMLSEITHDHICTFAAQWGEFFPKKENKGLLFVGKSVNGWVADSIDIEDIFCDSGNGVFAMNDQMIWVENCEGSNEGYNSRKSAFWRVNKKISMNYYPQNWYENVAWSNVCKVSPYEGNPSDRLYYEQLSSAQKILAKEIEILSPQAVVMFTSGWEKDFLLYLNNDKMPEPVKVVNWEGYQSILYVINGTKFIVSPHPQGKTESAHVDAVIELIEV